MSAADEQVVSVCPRCRTENPQDADVCRSCGTSVTAPLGPVHSADAAQLLGRVLNGKYKVLSVLGEGGMGVVYKVRHLILQRRNLFALKILHPKISNDQHFRTRFLREVEVAMELTHENIIQIRDFGLTEEGRLFFTMDYFEGVGLRSLIRSGQRMSQDRTVDILRQLLTALCEAHRQGIVHRDLKPENVLVRRLPDGGDQVKILDFGIAKILGGAEVDQAMTRGGILGSPRYMSPEQVAGDAVDHRSDLYSLGVIFFEMLTGAPPFTAKTAQAVLSKQLAARVPTLAQACPGIQVSAPLERLLMSLLEKDPGKRPATPRHVLDLLDGESTMVLPVGPRRRRGGLRAAALLAIGSLAFFVGWNILSDPSEPLGWAQSSGAETPPRAESPPGDSSSPESGDGKRPEMGTWGGTDATRGGEPASPSDASGTSSRGPVILRCQICGKTFADGELIGNVHHSLPLERVSPAPDGD